MWLLNLLKVIGIIFVMACCYLIATNPYTNPYKLIMIFGKKGSGKSTILTKYAIQYLKKGWTVYSTEHIPGVYYIPPGYIGKFMLKDYNYTPIYLDDYRGLKRLLLKLRLKFFPHRPKILLLIDEVGMIYDNRHFKNFNDSVRDFFKLQRHYYVKCVMFSQTFDVDKKLRDLTDCMYLVKNFARVFAMERRSGSTRILTMIQLTALEARLLMIMNLNLSCYFGWVPGRLLLFQNTAGISIALSRLPFRKSLLRALNTIVISCLMFLLFRMPERMKTKLNQTPFLMMSRILTIQEKIRLDSEKPWV